jgi:tetratricopeptide (TPR) repeat protein
MGQLLQLRDRHAEAEPYDREVVETGRRTLGLAHPRVLKALRDLAALVDRLGRPDEAEELLLEGLEASARDNGEADVSTTTTRAYLAKFYAKSDRMDEARAVISDQLSALRAAAEASSEPGPKNAYAWEALTCESADLQDPEDALVFALEAVELGQWQDLDVMDTLALAYHRTGNNAKAVEVEMKALDLIPEVDTARREPFESALAEYRSAIED